MKWFNDLKIAVKLLAGFILVALIAGVVGLVGVIDLNRIVSNDTKLYVNVTVPISQMAELSTAFHRIRVSLRDAVLADTEDEMDTAFSGLADRKQEITGLMPEIEKTLLTKEGQDVYKTFTDDLAAFYLVVDKIIALVKSNNDTQAINLMDEQAEGGRATKALQEDIDKLNELKNNIATDTYEQNVADGNAAMTTMIIVVAAAVVIAVLLGFFISSLISRPVGKLVKEADRIANGDLDVSLDITARDEIGILAKSFTRMAENLNDVMSNINSASEQVASGAKQVSASSMALSQGATEQASSVEELTASIEEISSQTKLNAQNAVQAKELAEAARENAVQGNNRMKEMQKAMGEINDASGNISKIIKVIDEIAFQTNILALNAAVEAARAGQHGKGFAVVAEEVRNLAARSANAAKETTDMIEGSIKKVEGGTKIANETAAALDKIVDGVAKAASLVSDIAAASNDQATGIAQVTQGLSQVSQVVQNNSATSQESAAASEELSSQAELLKEQVGRFKLKRITASFRGSSELSPEVLKLLEDMSERRKANPHMNEEAHAEAAAAKARIDLSDREFGKY